MEMREANAVLKLLYGYKISRRRANHKEDDEFGKCYRYCLVDADNVMPYGSMGLWTFPLERIVEYIIDNEKEAYKQ